MRHQKKGHKLGRDRGHRKRTLAALSNSLIENKRIQTTEAKAKALRPFIEPLITRAKEDTTHNRRQVFRRLQDKQAVRELFTDIAVEVGDRPGGYTRIIKLGQRSGDGAEMAMIELVDFNDVKPDTGSSSKSRTRRGSGKGRRKDSEKQEEKQSEAAVEEQSKEEGEDKSGSATQQQTASTTTTDQVENLGGPETDTVEEPVSEQQAKPVQERTETGADPEVQEQAKEATKKQQADQDEASDDDESEEEKS